MKESYRQAQLEKANTEKAKSQAEGNHEMVEFWQKKATFLWAIGKQED